MNEMRCRLPITLLFLLPLYAVAQEVCNNGIDDDGDGLVDLNDPDCPCNVVLNVDGIPSLLPNPSFEESDCISENFSTTFNDYITRCCSQWVQATLATSDYYDPRGWYPDFFPLPPPEGEKCVGFYASQTWNEYVGGCLTQPLKAGVHHRLTLWIAGTSMNGSGTGSAGAWHADFPMDLTLYGRPACPTWPVGTNTCPTIASAWGWQVLGNVELYSDGDWHQVTIEFVPPEDINAVMIGSACQLPPAFYVPGFYGAYGFDPYFLVDDLRLNVANAFVTVPVAVSGTVCGGDLLVTADPYPGSGDHQWYLDGVALVGQTGAILDASALGLEDGVYSFSSTYQGECVGGSVRAPGPEVIMDPVVEPVSGCAPLEVTFSITEVDGAGYAWSFGDGGQASLVQGSHVYTLPGTYDVFLRVISPDGCVVDSLMPALVHVSPNPVAAFTADPRPARITGSTVTLSDASSGDVVSWWWWFGDVAPGVAYTPSVVVEFPAEPGEYPVWLAVEDVRGCVDTVISSVVVIGEMEMPNVFSPNGDGLNDRFAPLRESGAGGVLEIYNRWGQRLFTTEALERGWDGQVEGMEAPAGTYYYTVTPFEGGGGILNGHLTLIR